MLVGSYFLHCVIQDWQDSLYMAKDKVGWEARLILIISTKSIGVLRVERIASMRISMRGLHLCVLVCFW